jgi:hypothetical protein
MNADHDFRIGSEHETCEDYALSGHQGDFAYAIVCDGCSSSPDVDFGARVLALSARETMQAARSTPMSYEAFGKITVKKADLVSALLPQLDPEFLDATLLIAWVDRGKLTAMMYGDGVFFHKTANSIRAIHVELKTPIEGTIRGAPDYLAYHLEELRRERYIALGGEKVANDCLFTPANTWAGTVTRKKPFDPILIEAPVAPGDVIALCSDGINSFRQPDDTQIAWEMMAKEFIGFKNFEGVFVKRRLTAFRRRCQKQLISHADDISIAAIVV